MPLVNRTFDQLIDFTRTSAATFVNSSGNIASTPQSRNLLTFTNEFANAAWTKTRSSITANSTAAPDGTNTADTLNEDSTASSTHPVSVAVTLAAAAHTLSVYVKASGRSWVQISLLSTANAFANFNVSTGALGTVGAAATATITSVGNGWYRCTMTATTGAGANTVAIYPASADNTVSFTGTGIASLFIWGAQLEQASAATDYTRNFGGLFPPRFDYDPVTRAPRGLLIEEQRTNLLLYSEQFDNVAWVKADSTVTANSTTSPDGTVDADSVIENTAAAIHRINQAMTVTNGVACAVSVYARAIGSRRLYINFITCAGAGALFDLTGNGAVVNVAGTAANRAATIQAAGNGWYRCTLIGTGTGTAGAVFFQINRDSSSTATDDSYTGDGTSGLILWGSQIEAGAFATSYIPTVASQVTRSADTAAINAPNFASWFNAAEGTLVSQFSSFATVTPTRTVAELNDGTTNNRYLQGNNPGGSARFLTFNGGVAVVTTLDYTAPAVGAVAKWATAYRAGDYGASLNGAAALTSTYGSVLSGINALTLGSIAGGGQSLNGHLRSLRYYPTRLTNAQLQALTA